MCEGASKLSPDPKNSTAPGPRPLVLKFLDPPLCWIQCRVKQYLRCLYTEVQGEKHIKTEYIGYRKKKKKPEYMFYTIYSNYICIRTVFWSQNMVNVRALVLETLI